MGQPDAVVLTAIGIGAAFGVLVALSLAALLIRLVAWAADKFAERRAGRRGGGGDDESAETGAEADPAALLRARAAAVAVTALIESNPNFRRDSDDGLG